MATRKKIDSPDKALNGKGKFSSSIERRKEERAEAMREYIKGHNYLRAINEDLDRDIPAADLPVVRFKTETRLALLRKVYPDMKSIEHSGPDGGAINASFNFNVIGVQPVRD